MVLLVAYSIICCFSLWASSKLHSMYDYAFRLPILFWRNPRLAVLIVVFLLYYCLLCVLDGLLAVCRCCYLAMAMPGMVLRSLHGLACTISLCVIHRVDTPLKVVLLYRFISECWYPSASCGNLCFALLMFLSIKDIHVGEACVPLSLCVLLRLTCGYFPWWIVRCLGLCEIFMPTFGKRGVLCGIMEAFFGFIDSLFARSSVIPWYSPQPNQEMLVTRLPAIRFCLNRYGFECFFKPVRSSMVSGSHY